MMLVTFSGQPLPSNEVGVLSLILVSRGSHKVLRGNMRRQSQQEAQLSPKCLPPARGPICKAGALNLLSQNRNLTHPRRLAPAQMQVDAVLGHAELVASFKLNR